MWKGWKTVERMTSNTKSEIEGEKNRRNYEPRMGGKICQSVTIIMAVVYPV